MSTHNSKCIGVEATQRGILEHTTNGTWSVIGVVGDIDNFYYTVGLHLLGLPELILIGNLPPDAAAQLINLAGNHMRIEGLDGFPTKIPHPDFANLPLAFLNVNDQETKELYCTQAYNFYNTWDFRLQQVVWTDTNGKFPWDCNSEFVKGQRFHNKQHIIGRS